MQKRKKQLLGFAGLAVVAGMTAVAVSLPTYADENLPEGWDSAANTTKITVNVVDNQPGGEAVSGHIASPKNNAELTEMPDVSITYSKANKIDFAVTRIRGGESEVVVNLSYTPTTDSGTWTVSAEELLAQLGDQTPQDGDSYKVVMVAHGSDGKTIEDSVTFSYRAVSVVFNGDTAENKDPIVKVTANSTAVKFVMQLYDGKKELFVNADGTSEPLVFTREVLDENGVVMITLPFAKYNIPTGEYELVTQVFGADGEYVSMNVTKIQYKADTPDVPGTGSILMDNLNISRADYLITGLIAFSAMVGFAVYLVFRKSRR